MPNIFDTVWASGADATVEVPTEAEMLRGFACGKARPGWFNWLFQSIQSAINDMGIGDKASKFLKIDTTEGITGGGDLQNDRTLRLDIPGLEAETVIANGDLVVVFDISANKHVKMTRQSFVTGLGGEAGLITDADNIGTGTGDVFAGLNDGTLEFRTLQSGNGIVVTTTGDVVDIGLANRGSDLTY